MHTSTAKCVSMFRGHDHWWLLGRNFLIECRRHGSLSWQGFDDIVRWHHNISIRLDNWGHKKRWCRWSSFTCMSSRQGTHGHMLMPALRKATDTGSFCRVVTLLSCKVRQTRMCSGCVSWWKRTHRRMLIPAPRTAIDPGNFYRDAPELRSKTALQVFGAISNTVGSSAMLVFYVKTWEASGAK